MSNPALEEMWRKYRGWALRARTIRNELDDWRIRVLKLTVAGAVFATLSAQLPTLAALFPYWQWQGTGSIAQYFNVSNLARIFSAASAVSMALAAYAGKSILDPSVERRWLRARALAESCKSDAFRFATGVAPYNTSDAGQRLLEKLQQLLSSGADIPAMEVDGDDALKGLPPYPMPVQAYIELRINEQVDGFFRPRARENEQKATKYGWWVQALSASAAVLGALGAISGGGIFAAWVATIGTVATAIGAHALGQRYQRLAATYRVTADRLALRLALWRLVTAQQANADADQALISEAEGIMAAENEAWLAEFLKDPAAPAAGGAAMPVAPAPVPASAGGI